MIVLLRFGNLPMLHSTNRIMYSRAPLFIYYEALFAPDPARSLSYLVHVDASNSGRRKNPARLVLLDARVHLVKRINLARSRYTEIEASSTSIPLLFFLFLPGTASWSFAASTAGRRADAMTYRPARGQPGSPKFIARLAQK